MTNRKECNRHPVTLDQITDAVKESSAYFTAGGLRAQGIAVPKDIPDVARIPCYALRYVPGSLDCTGDPKDPAKVRLVMQLCISGPFKWITMAYSYDPKKNTPQKKFWRRLAHKLMWWRKED